MPHACHCVPCCLQEIAYPAHHELMRQFHPITHVYILLEGSVELTALTSAPVHLPCDPVTLTPADQRRRIQRLSLVRSTTLAGGLVSGAGSVAGTTQPGGAEQLEFGQTRKSSVWDISGLEHAAVRVPCPSLLLAVVCGQLNLPWGDNACRALHRQEDGTLSAPTTTKMT